MLKQFAIAKFSNKCIKILLSALMHWESMLTYASMWRIDLQTQTCSNRHDCFVRNVIQLCSLQIDYMDYPLFSDCKLDACSHIAANEKRM